MLIKKNKDRIIKLIKPNEDKKKKKKKLKDVRGLILFACILRR